MTIARGRIQVVGWVLVLLLAACGRAAQAPTATPLPSTPRATERATPGALPTPTALVTPSQRPDILAASVEADAVFISPRHGYRVRLPCCWLAMPAPAAALEMALAGLPEDDLAGELAAMAERLYPQSVDQALELVAILPGVGGGAPQAQLTVAVLPSAGLAPAAFLEATLREFDLIAATQVQSAVIDWNSRDGGAPAVVVEYTTPGLAAGAAAIAGLQVALPSGGGDDYIVLTFTTTVEAYERLKPEFLHIVRLVEIAPPA